MIAQPQPLIEVFAEIPDFRRCRGKRHPLPAMLSLACCAMLCGYRSSSAIAEWGRNYGARIAHALGFTHHTPCAATLHTVLRHVDRDAVEAKLGTWAEGVVVSTPVAPSAGEAAIALDGKTLRGSRKQGAPGVHLLSALSHRLGLTLAQQGVDDKTKVFHMCWSLSDGSSKFIPIDEQPNHQIVHAFRLGKAQRATNQPLDPGPEIDVFALDCLRVLLTYMMLLDIDMPLIGPPSVGVILGDAKGL
jgi:hypothetical protein